MKELLIIGTLGVLVEFVVEIIKSVIDNGKVNKNVVLSLVIGILIAFTTQIDTLELLNIPAYIPYVGVVISGILISRGSNIVHSLMEKLQGVGVEPGKDTNE